MPKALSLRFEVWIKTNCCVCGTAKQPKLSEHPCILCAGIESSSLTCSIVNHLPLFRESLGIPHEIDLSQGGEPDSSRSNTTEILFYPLYIQNMHCEVLAAHRYELHGASGGDHGTFTCLGMALAQRQRARDGAVSFSHPATTMFNLAILRGLTVGHTMSWTMRFFSWLHRPARFSPRFTQGRTCLTCCTALAAVTGLMKSTINT